MSRLAEKLTQKESDKGSQEPVNIALWTAQTVPSTFWQHLEAMFGLNGTTTTSLTIRYSNTTGYTIEGATWRQIKDELGWSITQLYNVVAEEIQDVYELSHGWEASLQETIDELDAL